MDTDDFVKGVVAAVLTDQVDDKAGLASNVGWLVLAAAVPAAVFAHGWVRFVGILVAVLTVAFLVFVFVSKYVTKAVIGRFATPVEGARERFSAAVDEADLPTGPVAFLRMVWRLRNGVGPEVERLEAVVDRLRTEPT